MAIKNRRTKYLICVKNDGFPASLVVRKVYETIPDIGAEKAGFIRIVDESDEEYLYPWDFFKPLYQ